MSNQDTFILDIEWEVGGLPRLVGPFESRKEAEDWGSLNIGNGSWNVSPLAYPYMVSRGQRSAS